MGNMNGKRKRKNNSSSSSATDNNKKSLLPEYVRAILQSGIRKGYEYDYLDLKYKWIDDRVIPELCEWLIKLEGKIKVLRLNSNEITSTGASMLFDMLRTTNSFIKKISLYDSKQINDKCMKSLGEYIKSNKSIEGIWLIGNKISDTGIEILAPYLDSNTTLKGFNLLENKGITNKSVPYLVKMIESSHIENIDIKKTSITQENIIDIYFPLSCNIFKYGSTKLDLSFSGINDEDLIKICDGMKKYGIDKLKEIILLSNKITSKGASALFDTLRECNSIVSLLNLSDNQIGDECMKQLGEYVQDNEHLETLNFGSFGLVVVHNKITDKGIEIISEYLIGNMKLKELGMNRNSGITDVSVPYLIEIAKKSCMTEMELLLTSISEEKKQEIAKTLKIPNEEREIPIKSNTKSAAKISAST